MPSPTSSRGSGKTSSTACSARIGPPAAIRPTQRDVGRAAAPWRPPHGGQRRARRPRARLSPGSRTSRARGPVGVAAQPALLLQHRQLVGDRGRRGQADRLADLADRGRVAAALDRVADDLEHSALALGQAVAVGLAVGEGAHGGRPRCPRWRSPAAVLAVRRPALVRHVVLLVRRCRGSAVVRLGSRTVARRRPRIQTHVRSRDASCRFRRRHPVDIEQQFESNRRSTVSDEGREARVMGCRAAGSPGFRRGGPGAVAAAAGGRGRSAIPMPTPVPAACPAFAPLRAGAPRGWASAGPTSRHERPAPARGGCRLARPLRPHAPVRATASIASRRPRRPAPRPAAPPPHPAGPPARGGR